VITFQQVYVIFKEKDTELINDTWNNPKPVPLNKVCDPQLKNHCANRHWRSENGSVSSSFAKFNTANSSHSERHLPCSMYWYRTYETTFNVTWLLATRYSECKWHDKVLISPAEQRRYYNYDWRKQCNLNFIKSMNLSATFQQHGYHKTMGFKPINPFIRFSLLENSVFYPYWITGTLRWDYYCNAWLGTLKWKKCTYTKK
jgi:hypothetical protein